MCCRPVTDEPISKVKSDVLAHYCKIKHRKSRLSFVIVRKDAASFGGDHTPEDPIVGDRVSKERSNEYNELW
jgi:hypothetical protein